MKRNGYVE